MNIEKTARPRGAWIAAIGLSLFSVHVAAQEQPSGGVSRAWSVVPRVTVTGTTTDNGRVGQAGPKQSDRVLEVAPGVRVTAQGARLKGSFDFSIREAAHTLAGVQDNQQKSLNTSAALEAVENWLFVDFSGVIAQQSISALATQSASTATTHANQTETSTYRLSPYIRGKLWGNADYVVRYGASTTSNKSNLAANSRNEDWSARLTSSVSGTAFSWSAEASGQQSRFGSGQQTTSERLRGTLSYRLTDQLSLTGIVGQESNNYLIGGTQTRDTPGFGIEWNPTVRTRLSYEQEHRFFGTGYKFSFDHRTPRSAWRFNSSRDVQSSPGASGQAGPGSVFDLYFAQFASIEPDPIARALLVQAFLQANGISPAAVVNSGFLTSGLTVSQRSDLSLALIGARNTITFLFSRGETSRPGLAALTPGLPADDLTANGRLRQNGFNLTFTHKLSGLSSLNAFASQQQNRGSAGQDTRLRSLNVGVTHKLGPQTSAALNARRSQFESTTNPYTENALTGSLSHQF